jgi:hypothetical protein
MLLVLVFWLNTLHAFSQTWTQLTNAPNVDYTAVASSADGKKLVAVSIHGSICTTPDAGSTWVLQTNAPQYNWVSVASSACGNYLIAAAQSSTLGSYIYTSTNAGINWISNNLPKSMSGQAVAWYGVVSSAEGSKLAAVGSSKYAFTSTNYGATWTSNAVPVAAGFGFNVCASSADGTKLAIGGGGAPFYCSTNSGQNWTQVLGAADWWSLASSADGTKLVATAIPALLPVGPGIYTSTNSGNNWASNRIGGTLIHQQVASSADGLKLAVAIGGGGIYTSTNAGTSWGLGDAPSDNWSSIASSADGNQLVATTGFSGSGEVWISQTTPTPLLNIALLNTNLGLSWAAPSMQFSLQQSPDFLAPNWVTVTNMPQLNLTNLQYQVTLQLCISNCFYRLASP